MSEATLFIPDISGFTNFVKSSEIDHSKHIIEELIHIIITHGKKNFELAEVEGDAVFFYKEVLVTPECLISNAKQIFIAFHQHLLNYEYDRICECGACTKAVNLGLKFIAHSGDIRLANYGTGKAKPYGDAVITVHRLLKNEVPSDQYVLLTDHLLSNFEFQLDGKGTLQDGLQGKIPFKFLNIDHWEAEAVIDKKEFKRAKVDLEVNASDEIKMEPSPLYCFITEFKYRHLWNKEATKIIYDQEEINRSGSEHFCVVNGKDLFFDTIKIEHEKGLAYGEILKNPAPFKYLETNFLLSDAVSGWSQLNVIIRVSLRWKFQKLILPFIRREMKAHADKIIQSIREAVNKIPIEDLAV
ncbi:MAG: DUF2652 domain-containing protein [Bacteroidota bacterium]